MRLVNRVKADRRMEARIQSIVELGGRRDRILESPEIDVEALAVLVADYEAANMPCAAADLRRRLEYYREKYQSLGHSQGDGRSG